jgi:expansin (peptidoglycan-binding protein)
MPAAFFYPAGALAALATLLLTFGSAPRSPAPDDGRSYQYVPLLLKPAPQPETPAETTVYSGEATYYAADGRGSCSFDATPQNLMVAAIDDDEYFRFRGFGQATLCGAFIEVSGPKGKVVVRIVDRCPDAGCKSGHVDMSPQAFDRIAERIQGRVPITWRLVFPAQTGPIQFRFKEGSNQWWTAVQLRNHRTPIARLEYRNGQGQWVDVARTEYNYFVAPSGMGTGPYTFRVTDIYGRTLVEPGIPHLEAGTVAGTGQFPAP